MAGGQTLVPLLRTRRVTPRLLVSLSRIQALTGTETTPEGLRLGALVSYGEVEQSTLVRTHCPLLWQALGHLSDPAVRNRATLGGSLALGHPGGDHLGPLLLLEATVLLQSHEEGVKKVPFAEFLDHGVAPGQLVIGVEVPTVPGGTYLKISRQATAFALVAVALLGERFAVTGLRDRPVLGEFLDEAPQLPHEDVHDTPHASAEYRLHLADVLARRGRKGASP